MLWNVPNFRKKQEDWLVVESNLGVVHSLERIRSFVNDTLFGGHRGGEGQLEEGLRGGHGSFTPAWTPGQQLRSPPCGKAASLPFPSRWNSCYRSLLFRFQLNKYTNAPGEATNTHMLKLAWRHFLPPEREVCSLLSWGGRRAMAGSSVRVLCWKEEQRTSEAERVTSRLFFAPDFPSLSHLWKKLSTADTATFKVNHGLFVYVRYQCFQFKFSAIYSRPGNNKLTIRKWHDFLRGAHQKIISWGHRENWKQLESLWGHFVSPGAKSF